MHRYLATSVLTVYTAMTSGRSELVYVLFDIGPLIFFLILGIAAIIFVGIGECLLESKCRKYCEINCSCKSERCRECCRKCCSCQWFERFGNFLIRWLYGGDVTLAKSSSSQDEESGLYIDGREVKRSCQHRCLHFMLVGNVITIVTFLLMILADLFIIRSDFGCSTDRDCYVLNDNYADFPIQNCSAYKGTITICYRFNLEFLTALGDTGGVLLIAVISVIVITKLIISCVSCCYSFECFSKHKKRYCGVMITLQVVFAAVGLAVAIPAIFYSHKETQKNITEWRTAGYAIQYTAVLVSMIITTVTPWTSLIKPTDTSASTSAPNVVQSGIELHNQSSTCKLENFQMAHVAIINNV